MANPIKTRLRNFLNRDPKETPTMYIPRAEVAALMAELERAERVEAALRQCYGRMGKQVERIDEAKEIWSRDTAKKDAQ